MLFEFLRKQGLPINISRYLPSFLFKQENKNLQDILAASSWEHEKQKEILTDIAKQFFVETATWGLSDWERIVEVRPNPGDTYQQRRNRILLKLNGTQTATVEFMERLIKRYMEDGSNVKVTENPEEYVFHILLQGHVIYTNDLFEAIDIYKPAHLGLRMTIDTTPNKYERENQLIHGIGMASVKLGKSAPVLGEIQDATAEIGVALGLNGRGTKTALGGVALLPIEQDVGIGFDIIRLGRQIVPVEERDVPSTLSDILATGYAKLELGRVHFGRRGVQRVERSIDAGSMTCRPQILLAKGGTKLVPAADSIPPWRTSIYRGMLPIKMGRRVVSADMSDAPHNAVHRRVAFAGVAMAGAYHAG